MSDKTNEPNIAEKQGEVNVTKPTETPNTEKLFNQEQVNDIVRGIKDKEELKRLKEIEVKYNASLEKKSETETKPVQSLKTSGGGAPATTEAKPTVLKVGKYKV